MPSVVALAGFGAHRATVLGATEESSGASLSVASSGDVLWIVVPVLLGVLIGWLARRAVFGTTVTAVGVVGFGVTWYLAMHEVGIPTDGGGDSFDALGDALLAVMLYVGLLLAFGLVGLLGVGAIIGAFLRRAVTGAPDRGPGDAAPGGPAGDSAPPGP